MKVSIFHLCESINTRTLAKKYSKLITMRDPIILKATDNQWVFVSKYGVIVCWGIEKEECETWIKKLSPFYNSLLEQQNSENIDIRNTGKKNSFQKNEISIIKPNEETIATVSTILSRSLALERYEEKAQLALEQFTPVMDSFEKEGKSSLKEKNLLKMLGKAMNVQHVIVTHIPMLDKPSITWDHNELDRFYGELSSEYELEERYQSLSEKLKLLFQNVEFIQNYLDTRRGHLLEWIIIWLILFEVMLFIYDLWLA